MDNESDESMEPTEEVHSKDWVSQNWKDYCVVDAVGNSLRQTVHTHFASVNQAAKLVAALLRVAGVTAGMAESNGSLPPGFMTHVTCRLTDKNRDQLRNPTLGNRVWATFTYLFTIAMPLLLSHDLHVRLLRVVQ